MEKEVGFWRNRNVVSVGSGKQCLVLWGSLATVKRSKWWGLIHHSNLSSLKIWWPNHLVNSVGKTKHFVSNFNSCSVNIFKGTYFVDWVSIYSGIAVKKNYLYFVFLQEYQDDVRELLQIEGHTQKEVFLTKHTYDKFLKQVQQFFTPVWKKFGTPVLEEVMLETHFVSPILSYGCHSCDETFLFPHLE